METPVCIPCDIDWWHRRIITEEPVITWLRAWKVAVIFIFSTKTDVLFTPVDMIFVCDCIRSIGIIFELPTIPNWYRSIMLQVPVWVGYKIEGCRLSGVLFCLDFLIWALFEVIGCLPTSALQACSNLQVSSCISTPVCWSLPRLLPVSGRQLMKWLLCLGKEGGCCHVLNPRTTPSEVLSNEAIPVSESQGSRCHGDVVVSCVCLY